MQNEEVLSSKLGTKEHWDETYEKELENFKDNGDLGDVWFGEDSVHRVIKWMTNTDLITTSSSILDLGCGNGYTLLELADEGFTKLHGVDYSENAINLAKKICEDKSLNIYYESGDLLNMKSPDRILKDKYDVCHDKGTYDAINLCPESPLPKREKYIENIYNLTKDEGLFIITSANWTEDELKCHFKSYFEHIVTLPSPTFMFGGKTGNRETSAIFKKINKVS